MYCITAYISERLTICPLHHNFFALSHLRSHVNEFSNLPLSSSFSPNSFYSSSNPLPITLSIFFPPTSSWCPSYVFLLFHNHQSSPFLVRKENICSMFFPGHCNKSSKEEHCVFSSSVSEQFFCSAETWIHGIMPGFFVLLYHCLTLKDLGRYYLLKDTWSKFTLLWFE